MKLKLNWLSTMSFVLQSSDENLCSDERRAARNSGQNFTRARFEDLNESIAKSGVPIGTVEYCRRFMALLNAAEPRHYSYPSELKRFLRRVINVRDVNNVPVGWFIKPYLLKSFDGQIKTDATQVSGLAYCCPPVKFTFEWRYYVLRGKILGRSRYDDYDNEFEAPDDYVRSIISAFESAPSGYSIDVGMMEDGIDNYSGPALVEVNDGWALGYYRWGDMSEKDYLALVVERWREIVGNKMEGE